MPTELTIVMFPKKDQAKKALDDLRALDKEQHIKLVDVVIITKDAEGKARVQEFMEPDGKRGRNFGAVVGMVIGLTGGPIGVAIGAATGAVVGNITANRSDSGVKKSRIAEALEAVPNDGSAILAIFSFAEHDRAARAALRALGNDVRQFAISIGVEETDSIVPNKIVPPPPHP